MYHEVSGTYLDYKNDSLIWNLNLAQLFLFFFFFFLETVKNVLKPEDPIILFLNVI